MSKPLRLIIVDQNKVPINNALTTNNQNNNPINNNPINNNALVVQNTNINVQNNNQQAQRINTQNNPNYQQMQLIEVKCGVVTKIAKKNNVKDPTELVIHFPNMNKSFNAICKIFCPLREKDTIYTLCYLDQNQVLHITKQPFAQAPIDKDYVIQCFIRATKAPFMSCKRLYDNISNIAGGNDHVITYLSQMAQTWNDEHNSDLLYLFDKVEPDVIKKLLGWWYRERNLRRLWLFGLTNKEVNACRLTCDKIYEKCLTNPFTLPAIPLEKCMTILDILNKKLDINDNIRGSIIRIIWKNLYDQSWSCVPIKFVTKQFPELINHLDILQQDYGLIPDLDSFYLRYPHKVENWIADYIIDKCSKDIITYDMPIDDVIRHSAHFTREVSEDQKKAIHGALDHNISIITAPPGCGKCLGRGTKILMYDGSIKSVEAIVVGDLVMGPDSKPRKVLSKCVGKDEMFKIIPSRGRSFVCNTPHMLTLKGMVPYISYLKNKKKKHEVNSSERGIPKSKAFLTKEEAQTYLETLNEDIFDIPLDEYQKRTQWHKKYNYLFHIGIDFPKKDIPMDPYMIGFWLGDGSSDCSAITTIDNETIDYFSETLKSYGAELVQRGETITYGIRGLGENYHKYRGNAFRNTLNDLNLIDNKHIPDIYKINSREIRLELLAGLIDSDGHVHGEGNCIEIIQKNVKLSDDIEYLCFSLGFMVTRKEYTKGCMYKGEMRNGLYQRMEIFGEGTEDIPTKILRKEMKERLINKRATCLSFKVEPVGNGIYYGFTLDGDGRFLLGDFLVTHNTFCLAQIIHNLDLRNVPYAVASFTGKAVARIREVTKSQKPSTIHRLIYNAKQDPIKRKKSQFEKDIPLADYEHVIFDEASMITTELLYDFLTVYPDIKKLTFIGDANQLQPIGWGSFFQQMLKSETIPTYKLTTNFRVITKAGLKDGIILNANEIMTHDNRLPFEFIPAENFSVMEGSMERVYDIIRGCFNSGIKSKDLVVICPYNRYADQINRKFQTIYDMGGRKVTDTRGYTWSIGDRVMLTENDAEIGVFNGETGYIKDLTDKALLVDFGQAGCHEFLIEPTENNKTYTRYGQALGYSHQDGIAEMAGEDEDVVDTERTVKKLALSFCITVDKSQGSEYPYVIVYIPEFNTGSFINKNRIYTAFTRSQTMCWIVVSDIFDLNAAAIKKSPMRFDNLAKRLSNKLPNLKPFKIPFKLTGDNEMDCDMFDDFDMDDGYFIET